MSTISVSVDGIEPVAADRLPFELCTCVRQEAPVDACGVYVARGGVDVAVGDDRLAAIDRATEIVRVLGVRACRGESQCLDR